MATVREMKGSTHTIKARVPKTLAFLSRRSIAHMMELANFVQRAQAACTDFDLHLGTIQRERRLLDVGLECAIGLRRAARPATRSVVANIAPERDTLVADKTLGHDAENLLGAAEPI